MDDHTFLQKINTLLRRERMLLPPLPAENATADSIAAWARFLENCVRSGIRLSDPRWARLTLAEGDTHTVFALQPAESGQPDGDFVVGLRLLMGMLGDGKS